MKKYRLPYDTRSNTEFGDLKTSYQRIGFSRVYKLIAKSVFIAGLFVSILMFLAIQMYNLQTKNLEYRAELKNVIYLNTHH